MKDDSQASTSLWMATADTPSQSRLKESIRTDVCIIGAGIAGLTTAYLLAMEGRYSKGGSMEATGELVAEVRISWLFKKQVRKQFTRRLAGGGRSGGAVMFAAPPRNRIPYHVNLYDLSLAG